MPYFDRFDICEAHLLIEWDYNVGGWLRERPSNLKRMEATAVQLHRMEFTPHPNLSYESLTENGWHAIPNSVLRCLNRGICRYEKRTH